MGKLVPYYDFQAETFLRDELGGQNITQHNDELIHSCLLPFGLHKNGDRNPSASLNIEKLLYSCFVCGGGTLLWATQEILGLDDRAAKRLIEHNLQTDNQSAQQFLAELETRWSGKTVIAKSMPEYSMKLLLKWKQPTEYLEVRGISREVQDKMNTGINLNNMDEYNKEGDKVVQPRLVVPHIFKGKLRGWSMRKLDDEVQVGPKYKHTSKFPKDTTFYNWDNVMDKYTEVILVESPLSVLKLQTAGIENCIASFGAQITDNQVSMLRNFEKVIMIPDGDRTGYQILVDKPKTKFGKQEVGLITRLMPIVDFWIVDHGIIANTFTSNDAGDYNDEELTTMIQKAVPSYLWEWSSDDIQKVRDRESNAS
jgi:hypothetical protein